MTKTLTSTLVAIVMLSAGSAAFAGEFDTVDGVREYAPPAQVLTTKPVAMTRQTHANPAATANSLWIDRASQNIDGGGN